jgi:hypothetical protein
MALAGQREIVAGLDGLGYTDAWSSEVNGTDAFTPLVLAAQWARSCGSAPRLAGPGRGHAADAGYAGGGRPQAARWR